MRRAGILLAVSGLSFFSLFLSASACLLHWRVANEPGAQPFPEYLAAFRILLIAGLSGTLLSNGTLNLRGMRPLLFLLLPQGAALFLCRPVLALTLHHAGGGDGRNHGC